MNSTELPDNTPLTSGFSFCDECEKRSIEIQKHFPLHILQFLLYVTSQLLFETINDESKAHEDTRKISSEALMFLIAAAPKEIRQEVLDSFKNTGLGIMLICEHNKRGKSTLQ